VYDGSVAPGALEAMQAAAAAAAGSSSSRSSGVHSQQQQQQQHLLPTYDPLGLQQGNSYGRTDAAAYVGSVQAYSQVCSTFGPRW
jgi:hypothetical protein